MFNMEREKSVSHQTLPLLLLQSHQKNPKLFQAVFLQEHFELRGWPWEGRGGHGRLAVLSNTAHRHRLFLSPPQKGRPPFTLSTHTSAGRTGLDQRFPDAAVPAERSQNTVSPNPCSSSTEAGFCPESPVLPKSPPLFL